MTLFPQWIFAVLIWGGLGLVSVTIIVLVVMLARDWKEKALW